MDTNLSIWTITFLAVAGQGIFLSMVLFFNRNSVSRANRILAWLLLLWSLNTLENVAYWNNYLVQIPHFANSTSSFIYLYGPLFYFFIRSKLNPTVNFELKDLIHLTPFAIFNIWMSKYYSLSAEFKIYGLENTIEGTSNLVIFSHAATTVLLISYTVAAYRNIAKFGIEDKKVKYLVGSFASYTGLVTIYYIAIRLVDLPILSDFIISLTMAIFIYQIGYLSFFNPQFFNPIFTKKKSEAKYSKSTMSESASSELMYQIESLMENEKLYLNGDLRIRHIADRLDQATNNISQVINSEKGMTFLEYINSYRVKEAERLMALGKTEKITMAGIALDAGFNNKTSFNNYFKKHTGQTPKEYLLKQLQ